MLKEKRNKSPGDTFFIRLNIFQKKTSTEAEKKIITIMKTILKKKRKENAHGHVYFMLRTRIDRSTGLPVALLASGIGSMNKKKIKQPNIY